MKSATHQFIEDAIAGGWGGNCSNCQEPWKGHQQTRIGNRYCTAHPDIHKALLDPRFWQAVGKTRGWKVQDAEGTVSTPQYSDWFPYSWGWRWHRFIDHLADGKTIDEALAAIQDGV